MCNQMDAALGRLERAAWQASNNCNQHYDIHYWIDQMARISKDAAMNGATPEQISLAKHTGGW